MDKISGFSRGSLEFIDLELEEVALIIQIFNGLIFFLELSLQNGVLALKVRNIALWIPVIWRISVRVLINDAIFVRVW